MPKKIVKNRRQIDPKPLTKRSLGNVGIVDFMSLAYKEYHGMPKLTNKRRQASQVIFGVLSSLRSLFARYQFDSVILTWEGRNNVRKKIFDGYKGRRSATKAEALETDDHLLEFIEQINEIKKRFPEIGIPCIEADGYESDDVIAALTERMVFDQMVICSSDNDLHQLISKNVSVWDIRQKREVRLDSMKEVWGFADPMFVAILKGLAGCRTDEVPGLKGWGEKTALKFMEKCRFDLDVMIEELEKIDRLAEFDVWLRLVLLPFDLNYKIPLSVSNNGAVVTTASEVALPMFQHKIDVRALAKLMFDYDIKAIDAPTFLKKSV